MYTLVSKKICGNKHMYVCTDSNTGQQVDLDKDTLVNEINSGNVTNARVQVYKGQSIIRVKQSDKDKITTVRDDGTEVERHKHRKKTIYAIDLYKSIIKEFGIKQEEEALAVGFDKYELDTELDTSNKDTIAKLSYQMASDIKVIADKQNSDILSKYRQNYLK